MARRRLPLQDPLRGDQKACRLGKVDVGGQPAKPHREIKAGDEIDIGRPFGRRQKVVVCGLAEKHIAKAEARLLYEDVTPEALAGGDRAAADGAADGPVYAPPGAAGAPDKRSGGPCRQAEGTRLRLAMLESVVYG